MAASPEINRLNGKKSRGPVTKRGKAIASKNATKHGILAETPPILVTEDLETFQDIVQGLIDEYQPQGATEHLLIQQVAMGWLRLYRLWGVEAAIANIEILRMQRAEKFPDIVTPPQQSLDTFDRDRATSTPLREVLQKEKEMLIGLHLDLEYNLEHLAEQSEAETLADFRESMRNSYYREDRTAQVYEYHDEFEEWLADTWDRQNKQYTADLGEAIARTRRLIELAQLRLKEIDFTLSQIEQYSRAIQQAQISTQGIQKPELFARYEKAISSRLYDALDRLQAIQQQRHQRE